MVRWRVPLLRVLAPLAALPDGVHAPADLRYLTRVNVSRGVDVVKTRANPQSEIETCVRSSTTCILANLAMRFKTRIDWDEKNWTVQQQGYVGLREKFEKATG